MRQLAAHRTRLSNTEATASQLREMRVEIEEAFAERQEMLEVQARVEREMLKHLERRLQSAKGSARRNDEPAANVKSEMSPMRSRMKEQIESLLSENVRLSSPSTPSTPPSCPKLEVQANNQRPDPKSMDVADKISNQAQNPSPAAPKQSNIQTETPTSSNPAGSSDSSTKEKTFLVKRTSELEEQLQLAKNMICTLREAVKGKDMLEEAVSIMQKKLVTVENGEQCVTPETSGTSSGRLQDSESKGKGKMSKAEANYLQQRGETLRTETPKSRVDNQQKEVDSQERDVDRQKNDVDNQQKEVDRQQKEVDNQQKEVDNQQKGVDSHQKESGKMSRDESNSNDNQKAQGSPSRPSNRIQMGEYYVLVSHSKFFEIDWKKYYQQTSEAKFVCKKCPVTKSTRNYIQDHVWVDHCGGSFRCPYCAINAPTMLSRSSIRPHMKKFHPNKGSSKK